MKPRKTLGQRIDRRPLWMVVAGADFEADVNGKDYQGRMAFIAQAVARRVRADLKRESSKKGKVK